MVTPPYCVFRNAKITGSLGFKAIVKKADLQRLRWEERWQNGPLGGMLAL